MQDLLTLKEIARRLDVPESNLRYYKNRIGDFLPSVGKGRRRRYLPESEEVFRRTIALVQEGMTLDRVYKHLAQEQPPELESSGATPREEYAELIAGKVAEAMAGAPAAGQGDAPELGGAVSEIKDALANILRRMEGAAPGGENLQAALAESNGRCETLERELALLRESLAEKQHTLEETENRLREKERIIEIQKQQLLDARDKRLDITEELRQIKAMLGSPQNM